MIQSPHDEPFLGEREATFRRLSSAASEGITIVLDERVLEANNAFGRLFGYELAEVLGRKLLDFVAPESRDFALQRIALAAEKPYEVRGRRKTGETFDIEITMRSTWSTGSRRPTGSRSASDWPGMNRMTAITRLSRCRKSWHGTM